MRISPASSPKQQSLPIGRQCADDPLHVRPEAHVHHPVGFVEDEHLQAQEIGRPVPHVIHQPPGRGHDDVRTSFETALLRIHRHAAEHRHRRDRGVILQTDERILDLHDQLTRRRQNQRAREWLSRCIAKRRLLAEQLLKNR